MGIHFNARAYQRHAEARGLSASPARAAYYPEIIIKLLSFSFAAAGARFIDTPAVLL
jgi:hypothetical protein